MRRVLARTAAVVVVAICLLWIVGPIALPLLYGYRKGWGFYWAFSTGEFLLGSLLLLGPPVLLILVWRQARRQSPGEGAV